MSTDVGKWGEQCIADFLIKRKHTVLALNWRTRWCEIDVVSKRRKTVYFTEVKTRSRDAWGSGLAYITPKKLRQMHLAAERWVYEHGWKGDARLCAAEVNAEGCVVFIELEI